MGRFLKTTLVIVTAVVLSSPTVIRAQSTSAKLFASGTMADKAIPKLSKRPKLPKKSSKTKTLKKLESKLKNDVKLFRKAGQLTNQNNFRLKYNNSVQHGDQYRRSPYRYRSDELIPPLGPQLQEVNQQAGPEGGSEDTAETGAPASCTDSDIAGMEPNELVAYFTTVPTFE